MSPVMHEAIPATIPASIVRARAGRDAISEMISPPAETPAYKVSAKDEPITKRIGITIMSTTDHVPTRECGINLEKCSTIFTPPYRFHHTMDESDSESSARLFQPLLPILLPRNPRTDPAETPQRCCMSLPGSDTGVSGRFPTEGPSICGCGFWTCDRSSEILLKGFSASHLTLQGLFDDLPTGD